MSSEGSRQRRLARVHAFQQLTAGGMTPEEIAALLGASPRTVLTYAGHDPVPEEEARLWLLPEAACQELWRTGEEARKRARAAPYASQLKALRARRDRLGISMVEEKIRRLGLEDAVRAVLDEAAA